MAGLDTENTEYLWLALVVFLSVVSFLTYPLFLFLNSQMKFVYLPIE